MRVASLIQDAAPTVEANTGQAVGFIGDKTLEADDRPFNPVSEQSIFAPALEALPVSSERAHTAPESRQNGAESNVVQPQKASVAANANATNTKTSNATIELTENKRVANTTIGFAQPSGWGELWRLERNGKYFFYRLRFTDSRDVPQDLKRITRPGGRIDANIEAALKKRKGSGRHKESRVEADSLRRRAIALAGEFRPSATSGTTGEAVSRPQHSDHRATRGSHLPELPVVDDGERLPRVHDSSWVM